MIRIKTNEAGKQIILTSGVPALINVCNIINIDAMQSTIVYDAGSAEFTVLNRCYVEISGLIYFIRDTLETANLTIDLYLNGAYLQRMYTGISDERILMSYQKSFEENDVLKFMVTCPDDITIETDDAEHYITIKKIAQ